MSLKWTGLLGLMGVLALAGQSQAATRDAAPAAGFADVLVPGPNGHVLAPTAGDERFQLSGAAQAMTIQYYYDRYHHRHWHRPYYHHYYRHRHGVRIGPVVIH